MSRSTFIIPSVALLVAAGVTPAGAQVRTEVVTTRRATPATAENEPFKRLQRQLDSLTQRYNDGEELSANDRRRIETELGHTIERLAVMMSRMNEEMKVRGMMRTSVSPLSPVLPRGWIGIVAEGPGMEPRLDNGELVVRYLSYPRIVSVDPSSPAQTAGIMPNDTLLAYDGRDVRDNDINLNRLLRPNAKLNVSIRRDGRTRDVPVVVAEAPSRIALRRNDEVRDERVFLVAPNGEGTFTTRIPMAAPNGGMGRGGSVRMTPTPVAATAPSPSMFSFTMNGVAGAQLVTVTEGLGKRLGVNGGVLVTSAPVGSPASQSGIEDGDVIVRIGGQAVRTVIDVRRAVGAVTENGQRAVELEILRDAKTIRTTLRW